ncbi:MAG: hypothetical protein RL394_1116 [Bacteroidota bacterium]
MSRILHIYVLTILAFQPMCGKAQEVFVESPSTFITSFSFRMLNGGVILLRAGVNDFSDSLNFILDTGSGGISLDSTTVEDLGIPITPSDKTIKGIAGVRKVSFLNNATLRLPGLAVDNLNFHVNDYEILTSVYGIKIDGIIGYSFFSRYIVNINYDFLQINVFSKGEYKYPSTGFMLYPMFTALPLQSLQLTDSRKFVQRFYLDTGAGLNFLLSENYLNDSAVLKKRRKPPVVTQAEGVGGKMSMRLTTIKELKVGPYRFKWVPTFLFKDEFNVTNYPFVGGLLGNDILRRFNITFNYAKQQVHIVPNLHYKDDFDYAYSGLSIYYIDDKIVVDDVVPSSPAEKAGFKKEDIIVAINNDTSNNIQTYKTIMQTLGQKLKFLVIRDGIPMMLSMKPKSIL